MVNKFGDDSRRRRSNLRGAKGARGPPGPKGDPGRGGIDDMCTWIPNIVIGQFQRNEQLCLLITEPSRDLHKGNGTYLSWLSRSTSGLDAKADDDATASKSILHISEGKHALVFEKCMYWVDHLLIMPQTGYTSICVTFMVDGNEDMTIVSDFSTITPPTLPFREISASNKEIRIWGVDTDTTYLSIEYKSKKNEWITLFVEWHTNGDGIFTINNNQVHGVFACRRKYDAAFVGISIGSRYDDNNQRYFKGVISSLDIYVNQQRIPLALKDFLISRRMITIPKKEAGL